MARMNSGIILAGQTPNMLNTLAQSDAMAARKQEMGRRNRLDAVMQQHGPGILAGNQNALDAFARVDPTGAMNMQNQRSQNSRANERLRFEIARYAEGLSAEQAAKEAEEARRNAIMLSQVTDEASYDALAARLDPNLVGTFANKDQNVQMLMTSAELLEASKPAKPMSGPGKVQADINAGILPQDTPLRSTTPMVQIGAGNQELAGPLPSAPDASVSAGSGRNAFGATGMIGNAVNSVTDFLGQGEVFEELGENVRFFRNLEEDLLVGLSQAYGRQPAQQLMERLRSLLPNVGTTEGSQAAYRELMQMRNRFERDLEVAKRNAAGARRPADQDTLSARALGIESAIQQIDEGIRRLAPPEPAVEGISDDVMKRLERY